MTLLVRSLCLAVVSVAFLMGGIYPTEAGPYAILWKNGKKIEIHRSLRHPNRHWLWRNGSKRKESGSPSSATSYWKSQGYKTRSQMKAELAKAKKALELAKAKKALKEKQAALAKLKAENAAKAAAAAKSTKSAALKGVLTPGKTFWADPKDMPDSQKGMKGSCVALARNAYSALTGKSLPATREAGAKALVDVSKAEGFPTVSKEEVNLATLSTPAIAVWGSYTVNGRENPYGHAAVVTEVKDGMVTVAEANNGPNMDAHGRTDNYGKVTTTTMSIAQFEGRFGGSLVGFITQ